MSVRTALDRFLAFLFTICSSCSDHGQIHGMPGPATNRQAPKTMAINPQKITCIFRDCVYDLSAYADEGGGNPFNLFDENAFVDPQQNIASSGNYIPATSPQPTLHPAIYFTSKRGSRIVTDLIIPYQVTDIYLYDQSSVGDSIWIYTGQMNHWNLKVALETSSNSSAWGWRKFSINDSTRYIMFQFSSYESRITEAVLYGNPWGSLPNPPSPMYTGSRLSRKTMKDFLGVNYIMENEPKWIHPFHFSRLYNFALDFDNDEHQQFSNIRYNMLHYGHWNQQSSRYEFDIDRLKNENNGIVWYSIRGVPLWLQKKGFTDKDRPVTQLDMDPEDPLSYARHANMMWNICAFFGSAKVDTTRLSLSHWPAISGRGTMNLFENGNEEDAWWVGDKYCSPMSYFAQSSADYDGHEMALGSKCGIKNADPGSRLVMSGLVGLDTNRVKVYKFLCTHLRKDRVFIWSGGIQYHHYSNKDKKGITPEEDSLRWKLTKVRDCTYRIEPMTDCILGENGYDKSPASWQASPVLPGSTREASQAAMILRSINATAFSGFDAYILYWLKDGNPADDPRVYLTSGILRQMPDGKVVPYPAWFFLNTFVNQLRNYAADTIIKENGNVWVYKYRNQIYRDSVAYFVYCPTRNGTIVNNYPLYTGKTTGRYALEINFSETEAEGQITNKPLSTGRVLLKVEERPKLLLVQESK